MDTFSSMNTVIIVIMCFTGVIIVGAFIYIIASFVSPKFRGKMMGKQVQATKYMMDNQKDNIKSIATDAANASKEGIEITTRAIKDGFTKSEAYCKDCGEIIDEDSKFCKKCGKEQ